MKKRWATAVVGGLSLLGGAALVCWPLLTKSVETAATIFLGTVLLVIGGDVLCFHVFPRRGRSVRLAGVFLVSTGALALCLHLTGQVREIVQPHDVFPRVRWEYPPGAFGLEWGRPIYIASGLIICVCGLLLLIFGSTLPQGLAFLWARARRYRNQSLLLCGALLLLSGAVVLLLHFTGPVICPNPRFEYRFSSRLQCPVSNWLPDRGAFGVLWTGKFYLALGCVLCAGGGPLVLLAFALGERERATIGWKWAAVLLCSGAPLFLTGAVLVSLYFTGVQEERSVGLFGVGLAQHFYLGMGASVCACGAFLVVVRLALGAPRRPSGPTQ